MASTSNKVNYVANCRWCGETHGVLCPHVKSIEYFEDGFTVKSVTFKTAADFMAPIMPAPAVPPYDPTRMPLGPINPMPSPPIWAPPSFPGNGFEIYCSASNNDCKH